MSNPPFQYPGQMWSDDRPHCYKCKNWKSNQPMCGNCARGFAVSPGAIPNPNYGMSCDTMTKDYCEKFEPIWEREL